MTACVLVNFGRFASVYQFYPCFTFPDFFSLNLRVYDGWHCVLCDYSVCSEWCVFMKCHLRTWRVTEDHYLMILIMNERFPTEILFIASCLSLSLCCSWRSLSQTCSKDSIRQRDSSTANTLFMVHTIYLKHGSANTYFKATSGSRETRET